MDGQQIHYETLCKCSGYIELNISKNNLLHARSLAKTQNVFVVDAEDPHT